MRPVEKIRRLCEALRPDHLTAVVDVGANPFAGSPPYGTLRRSDCCTVTGFEPQAEALRALRENARHNDRFLPHAIGDGSTRTLYITRNSGLVSTLRPQPRIADLLGPWWQRATEITETLDIETRRLDDIDEITRIDFLKIDIQGGELDVFRHARGKLRGCAAIQTEICLHPYYDDQPSFGAVQQELTTQGFIAHKFTEISAHPIAHGLTTPRKTPQHRSQVTVADLVFIRDPSRLGPDDTETLRQLAILSYAVFRSHDLTLRCLADLAAQGALAADNLPALIDTLGL